MKVEACLHVRAELTAEALELLAWEVTAPCGGQGLVWLLVRGNAETSCSGIACEDPQLPILPQHPDPAPTPYGISGGIAFASRYFCQLTIMHCIGFSVP